MKRAIAWKGFYTAVKKIQTARAEGGKRKEIRGYLLQAAKYGKSLVMEHGWEDKYTQEFCNYTPDRGRLTPGK